MIRVFLADDNRELLNDLREELADQFDIVGTAENGKDTVQSVLRLNPDVLVLDVSMPYLNGLEVASYLQSAKCRARILFLTIHEEPEYISAAFAAGAAGYVSKRRLGSDLAQAIEAVFDGHTFLSPSLHE